MTRPRQRRPRIDPVVWRPGPARRAEPLRAPRQDLELSVVRVPGRGTEDVVVDAQGHIFTGVDDGRIFRISEQGSKVETIGNTGGRPLGLELFPDGSLLVCDAYRGLLKVDPRTGAVHSLVDGYQGTPFKFCNNAAVAGDGSIYFSDSSTRFALDFWRADLFEHSGTGRLFRFTKTGQLELLLDGLHFANGVALAPDDSFVAVAETGAYRITRLWLRGPRAGQRDRLIEDLPGFPDNISTGSDGLIWVTQASPRNPVLDFLHPRHPVWRKLAWSLPEPLQPSPKRCVWVLGVDMEGRVVHDIELQSPQMHMVTGVREHEGELYLGSLAEPVVGVLGPRR